MKKQLKHLRYVDEFGSSKMEMNSIFNLYQQKNIFPLISLHSIKTKCAHRIPAVLWI